MRTGGIGEIEARFLATFENAAVGIAHVSPDGSWLRVNRRLCEITGYAKDELLAKTFKDITHPEDLEADLAQLRRMPDSGVDTYNREKRYLHKDGSAVWVRLTVDAVRKGDGAVDYFISVFEDISEQKLAEIALRESEEKFRGVFENAATGIAITDLHGRFQCCNRAYSDMLGYTEDELRALDFPRLIHPEDRAANIVQISRILARQASSFEIVNRSLTKDGRHLWVQKHVSLFRDTAGEPTGIMALVTEAEGALRESEERLRLSNEAAGIGTFTVDLERNCAFYSPEAAAMFGFPGIQTATAAAAFLRVHRDDVARVRKQYEEAASGKNTGQLKMDFRFVRPGGEVRWMTWIGRVDFRENQSSRRPFRILGACLDITERKCHEDQVRLLLREVNHRSKNMLALVQAVARQTLASNPKDFLDRFGKRVQALAASQDLLVKNAWQGADLNELVRSQLAHFDDLIGTRIELQGPFLFVSASTAQTIGMALHELATNAGKYGALVNNDGVVKVEWGLERREPEEETFAMSWYEQGGPPVTRPAQSGFGSTVICRLAEMSLNGKVDLDFAVTGLTWQLQCRAKDVLEGDHSEPAAASPSIISARLDKRSRILVVEDEPLVAIEIAQVLNEAGFAVMGPARNVAPALSLIDETSCDAAVLDIKLGGETSEPIACRLLARGTPFVTLSGYSRTQHPPVFDSAPALAKPLQPELLIAELKRCLKQEGTGKGG
ncbi:MAG: PAS domain S-box protein [Rhodomicrobium sp.]